MNTPQLPMNRVADFTDWLKSNGSDVLPCNTEWEVVRFGCRKGVGTVYRNAKEQQRIFPGWVISAIVAFKANKQWEHHGPTEKPPETTNRPKSAKGIRTALRARDGAVCWFCGADETEDAPLTVEHFVAVTEGGPNRLSNMCLACKPCNDEAGVMCVVEKVALRDRKRKL